MTDLAASRPEPSAPSSALTVSRPEPSALSPQLVTSRPEPSAPSPEPRISIVTPSFNQGKYLEKTILSVLDQGYPNLEYIIIDGGSTDESVEIIRKYTDRLTYWVSEPDRGQSHAINKGFERATRDVFGWKKSEAALDDRNWKKMSAASLDKVWDNAEDDVYNELL